MHSTLQLYYEIFWEGGLRDPFRISVSPFRDAFTGGLTTEPAARLSSDTPRSRRLGVFVADVGRRCCQQ